MRKRLLQWPIHCAAGHELAYLRWEPMPNCDQCAKPVACMRWLCIPCNAHRCVPCATTGRLHAYEQQHGPQGMEVRGGKLQPISHLRTDPDIPNPLPEQARTFADAARRAHRIIGPLFPPEGDVHIRSLLCLGLPLAAGLKRRPVLLQSTHTETLLANFATSIELRQHPQQHPQVLQAPQRHRPTGFLDASFGMNWCPPMHDMPPPLWPARSE